MLQKRCHNIRNYQNIEIVVKLDLIVTSYTNFIQIRHTIIIVIMIFVATPSVLFTNDY